MKERGKEKGRAKKRGRKGRENKEKEGVSRGKRREEKEA